MTLQMAQAPGGVELLELSHPLFSARVSLQGAQLLSFKPADGEEWLWLSEANRFQPGEEIWGGIPLCLPWFGRVAEPIHGFARFHNWELTASSADQSGVTLLFAFHWDREHPFTASLRMRLGSSSITLTLTFSNESAAAQPFSFAFHSYLQQPQATAVVNGLEGRSYLDNHNNLALNNQQQPLVFHPAVDRVFTACGGSQQLGPLTISGENCPTVVAWNPGPDPAMTPHLGENGYQQFVCVERGAAFADAVTLQPNETYTSSMTLATV